MRRFQLVVLYVEYDRVRYAGSFERLATYLQGFAGHPTTVIRIDNQDEGTGARQVDANTWVLQGDNRDREFSAWQRGVEFLRERNLPCDVVLFVNEAFEASGTSFLRYFAGGWLLWKTAVLDLALGRVDTFKRDARVYGQSARWWICTSCFLLSKRTVDRLGSVVSVREHDLDAFLAAAYPGPGAVFRPDAPLNQAYRDYVVEWLTRRWHSHFELGPATWRHFRAKVRAILNEAMLSVRIRRLGVRYLPPSIPGTVWGKLLKVPEKLGLTREARAL